MRVIHKQISNRVFDLRKQQVRSDQKIAGDSRVQATEEDSFLSRRHERVVLHEEDQVFAGDKVLAVDDVKSGLNPPINHQASMPLKLLHHLSFQSQFLLVLGLEYASGFLCKMLSCGGCKNSRDDLRPN